MPIDYSKWDSLEISDDEDFECHPNVDKKSMMRWKQQQIHRDRTQRQDQLGLLKKELETTDRFLKWLPEKLAGLTAGDTVSVVSFLTQLGPQVEKEFTDVMRNDFKKRMEKWPQNWDVPDHGPVLREHKPWDEQVAEVMKVMTAYAAEHKDSPSFNLLGHVKELFNKLLDRYAQRQPVIKAQIDEIQKQIDSKITMENLKTGFDKTAISEGDKPAAGMAQASNEVESAQTVETIHTPAQSSSSQAIASAAEEEIYEELHDEIVQEMESSEEDLKKCHPKLLAFSQMSDFGKMLPLLMESPDLLTEKNEDALLIRALTLEILKKSKEARNCVITSLILKYSRNLGKGGVQVFFSKLEGSSSNAQSMFFNDVEKTYGHIQKRGQVLRNERIANHRKHQEAAAEHEERLKALYELFLQEDGSLKYALRENPTEEDLKRAEWFNALDRKYQEGLLLQDVDKINEFLGSLDEGEADRQAKMAIEAGFIQVEEEED